MQDHFGAAARGAMSDAEAKTAIEAVGIGSSQPDTFCVANRWMVGSSVRAIRAPNGPRMAARNDVCSGGSIPMRLRRVSSRTAPPMSAAVKPPHHEENCSGVRDTNWTSSCRVMHQKPGPGRRPARRGGSGWKATGASARSAAKAS